MRILHLKCKSSLEGKTTRIFGKNTFIDIIFLKVVQSDITKYFHQSSVPTVCIVDELQLAAIN